MLKAFKKLIFINIAALLMTGCAKPEKTYTLSVTSEDTARGTVTGGGSFTFNSSVTVNATPEECYSFIGWFNDETKVSTKASYTFTMPANDYSLVAKFKLETLTYGLYPQNHVSDEELISKLNELTPSSANEAGYYSYNEELYCPCVASPDWEGIHFEDDVEIVKGTKYWFKVESIKWRVLNEADGFVTSSRTLDMHQFDKRYDGKKTKTDYQGNTDEAYPNNYKYSEMRSWLNTEFYANAFQNDTRIKVSEVDNSVTSTAFKENEYVCENTFDKIFLLSY